MSSVINPISKRLLCVELICNITLPVLLWMCLEQANTNKKSGFNVNRQPDHICISARSFYWCSCPGRDESKVFKFKFRFEANVITFHFLHISFIFCEVLSFFVI